MREVSPRVAWTAVAALAVVAVAAVLAFRELAEEVTEGGLVRIVEGPPAVEGPWAASVAPASVCPGGDDAAAPAAEQARTMLCLVDFARRSRGLAPLAPAAPLFETAAAKAGDVVACGRFAHDPCGEGADAVFEEAGYGAGATQAGYGENLAVVSSNAATPRYVLNGWLESDPHRRNLFRAGWTEQGVALVAGTTVGGYRDVNLWVSHLGFRR